MGTMNGERMMLTGKKEVVMAPICLSKLELFLRFIIVRRFK